ncbi:hypothetical protein KR018_002277, partial [Drosophila ironensis]
QMTLLPGYLLIPIIFLGKTAESNSHAVNKSIPDDSHGWAHPEYGRITLHNSGRRSEKVSTQNYNREAERNVTLKRGSKSYHKPSDKLNRHKIKYKSARRKNTSPRYADEDNSDTKHYHTFEEIHEHVEDDAQYQASEQLATKSIPHESGKDHSKEGKRMKVKIKHHHHHHHHNHIKEIIKTVPQPYPVEKVVHVPIEKIVEKIVHVPKLVNVTVEKIVHVPIEKIVEKVIHIPKPVQVPKPYIVEKVVEKIIHVPKPYPVLRTVPYPVEIKVPVPMEKKVPVPFKVEVERKVPIYIRSSEPYKFEPSPFEHPYHHGEEFKFNMELDHPPPREHDASSLPSNYYNSIYKPKDLEVQRPRPEEFRSVIPSRPEEFRSLLPPLYSEESPAKTTLEQPESPGRDPIALKLVGPTPNYNSTGKDLEAANSAPPLVNSSSYDLHPQESANAFRGIPFALPLHFVQLQPMTFQSPINVEPSAPAEEPPK